MITLRPCYDKLKAIIGNKIEPYAVVETVEAYRQYFKPPKVNIILLAESHVYTSAAERAIQVQAPSPNLPSYPSNFARFVYCLGYGENDLLKGATNDGSNTNQYWKLLLSCQKLIHTDIDLAFDPILKTRTKTLSQRIANKVALLKRLSEMGVWLVDASITGIYQPKGVKPSARLFREVLRCSWDNHVKPIVETESPKYVICIGKGVWDVLGKDVQTMMRGHCQVFSQPQARNGVVIDTYQKCFRICSEYCN